MRPWSHKWLPERVNREVVARSAGFCRGELLDVGCGDRPYEDLIGPHVTRYVGLEHPETLHARERVDVWGDAMELPFPEGSFDTVVSFQVLEHVPQPRRMLAEAFRVLRPGGRLLITTPFMWGIHEAPRDFYRYTPYGLEHLASEAGFTGVSVRAVCGYWGTAGARFSYHVQRFASGPGRLVVPALVATVQLLALALDRVDRDENDAGGYVTLASRPG